MDDLGRIPGTPVFGGAQAAKAYPLNKMCFDFNAAANRAAFLQDEEAWMRRYGLDEACKAAIRARNVQQLIEVGGNIYYLAKLTGIHHLNVQDIGAQQTGMSVADFKAMLMTHKAN